MSLVLVSAGLSSWHYIFGLFDAILLYLLVSAWFDKKTAIFSGSVFLTSLGFLMPHLDLTMVLLALLSLVLIYSSLIDMVPLIFIGSTLLATTGPFSLPFYGVALFFMYNEGRLTRGVYLIPALYPLWHMAQAVHGALVRFVVTEKGMSISEYSRSTLAEGILWSSNSASMILFILFGLGYSYYRWVFKKDKRFAPLALWISVLFYSWFVISYPYATASWELFNLYKTDIFIYLASFPGAIGGGLLLDYLWKEKGRGAPLAIIALLVGSGLSIASGVQDIMNPYEENKEAMLLLQGSTSKNDGVLTSQGWVSDYLDARAGDVYYPGGDMVNTWGLLSAPRDKWEWFGITESKFISRALVQYKDNIPRYVLLTKHDIQEMPHIYDFFTNAEFGFEVAYMDESSSIFRIIYFDRDYAKYEPIDQIPGKEIRDISPVGVVSSYDASPEYIGDESWLAKFMVDGQEMYFAVNKETGEIMEVNPEEN